MRYFLALFILLISFKQVQARVKVFAEDPALEKSTLLVKGENLRGMSACLWLFHETDKSNVCDALKVRINSSNTRAKIYLPSVDKDTQARLYVTSDNGNTEQQFLVNIKDLINERRDFMSRFKFFTKKSKKDAYNLSANKEKNHIFDSDSITDLKHAELSHRAIKTTNSVYAAQNLTFNPQADTAPRRVRKNTSKRRKTRFNDLMRIKPRAGPPSRARLGYIYVDSSNALCIYMDGIWQKVVGSGTCENEELEENKE